MSKNIKKPNANKCIQRKRKQYQPYRMNSIPGFCIKQRSVPVMDQLHYYILQQLQQTQTPSYSSIYTSLMEWIAGRSSSTLLS